MNERRYEYVLYIVYIVMNMYFIWSYKEVYPGGGEAHLLRSAPAFPGLLLKKGGKWLGENIKPWIENRATLRHNMVNLPSF